VLGFHSRCRQQQENLQRELERIRRENQKLREQITDKDQELAEQQRHIQDLERKLESRNRNSTNSSKPPSSDGLAGRQRERGRKPSNSKKRRKPGGQPGHPGHHRTLVPVEQVQAVKILLPQQCRHCGEQLSQESLAGVGEPHRHQVTEIPKVQAFIIEYQRPRVVCGSCQKSNCAPLPEEVQGQFGPQLTALIAYWTVVCRLPRRLVEGMLTEVLGITLSLGSTQKAWEEVSAAVQAPYQELQHQLPQEKILNADETGWRTTGDKRWLWAFVAPQFVFYWVSIHRSTEVLVSLLGAVFHGVLCSDRYSVYGKYHQGRKQFCWAHLKRALLALVELRSLRAQRFGRDALAIVARMFRLWHRFRGDLQDGRGHPQPLDRQELLRRSIPLQKKLFQLAEAHLDDNDKDARNLARALFTQGEHLYTFLEEAGVEPTNNAAERALRTAVQWRKISFGNRSRQGELATARLLTIVQTCKRQRQPILTYLTQAVVCYRRRSIPPSLLHKSASQA
jgi:transposase